MDTFELKNTFNDYKSLLIAKTEYERASNTILTTETSHFLQGEGEFVDSKRYDRITYICKAGKERPAQSKGIRQSSTYKANCPFKVNLKLIDGKFVVTSVIPGHENHDTDRKTFLSYPENVRLSDSEVADAKRMIESGGSKQRIKAMLSGQRVAPVPVQEQRSAFNTSLPITILSSIENIKIPDNNNPVGRPKGSSLTAIGTKRKNISNKMNLPKRVAKEASPQKFCEKSSHQQALTVIKWLTNQTPETCKNKISSKEIITNPHILNRLRNDEVSLDHLKDLVQVECYEFLQNEYPKLRTGHGIVPNVT